MKFLVWVVKRIIEAVILIAVMLFGALIGFAIDSYFCCSDETYLKKMKEIWSGEKEES